MLLKKFFVGVFVSFSFISQALCVIRSDYKSEWNVSGLYSSQINSNVIFSTTGGYINGVVAINIYKNGGYFCPIRISHDTNSYSFGNDNFVYYARDTSDCKTICKPGYQGTDCNTPTTTNTTCDDTDYTSFFQSNIKTLTGFNRTITYSINIFGSGSTYGTSIQNGQTYYTDTLGIIDFIENGVVVAPIRFSVSNLGASARASSNPIILCATGYIVNDNKCVKSGNCSTQSQNTTNYNACDGYDMNKYDATIHVLKTKKQGINCTNTGFINICHGSETCTYFECRDGLGVDPDDSTKCISCGSDIRSGITSGGTCVTCEKGEYYNKNASDFCSPAMEINKSRMERYSGVDCWMKTDKSDYKNCVI